MSEGPAPSATPRVQPFYCPYCGEEELRPDQASDSWYCQSCARAFALKFLEVRR